MDALQDCALTVLFLVGMQTFLKVFKRHQKENEALLKRYTKARKDIIGVVSFVD